MFERREWPAFPGKMRGRKAGRKSRLVFQNQRPRRFEMRRPLFAAPIRNLPEPPKSGRARNTLRGRKPIPPVSWEYPFDEEDALELNLKSMHWKRYACSCSIIPAYDNEARNTG